VYLECLVNYINDYGNVGLAENEKCAAQLTDFSDWVMSNMSDAYLPEVSAAARACKDATNKAGKNISDNELTMWKRFLSDAKFGVSEGRGAKALVDILADPKSFSPNSVYPARMAKLKLSNTGSVALAWVGVALNVASAGTNIWDTFSNISKVDASLDTFKANYDLVSELQRNSKNQTARNAAQTLLNKMKDEANSALENTEEILRTLVLDNGITIAADTSLSVFAGAVGVLVTIEKGLFDLAFDISNAVRAACQCTFYRELYIAATGLFEKEVYVDKSGFGIEYYFIKNDETHNFERLLAHAAIINIVYQSSLYEYNIRQPFSNNDEAKKARDRAVLDTTRQMESLKIGF
jgi:hypothetical protein